MPHGNDRRSRVVRRGARRARGGADQEARQGRGKVDIVAWPGYIERGETDKNYDWVTDFEKKTGCKVNVKTAGTSDEMVALMNEGGFDLVTASGDASLRLIAGKRVQPINIELVPSWKTVDERLQNAPWHTVDGKHYGVPYQWGANVLAYNTKVFKDAAQELGGGVRGEEPPDGKSNKGRVQAFDGPIYIADAALYLMKHKPELGIKDPYELNEEQYKAALDLLRAQRKLVGRYWHDAMIQIDDFKNEGVVASSSWPFQVNLLQGQKQPIASTVPEEGATGWADTTMMHAEAPHPNCAYMWLEHSINPEAPGRSCGLVRLGAGGARGLQGQRAARATPAAKPTASASSTDLRSGARRSPNATASATLRALLSLGHRTTSPFSAAADAELAWNRRSRRRPGSY